ncbi:MAG TPA: sensor histidine kinase [Streptosporangiaceae bacterium]
MPVVVAVLQLGFAYIAHVKSGFSPSGHWSSQWSHGGWGPPWARQQGGPPAPTTPSTPSRPIDVFAYMLLALGPAAMVFRRRYRTPAFFGVMAADCAYFALGYTFGPAFVSLLVALFVAVLNGPRLFAWLLCPVAYALVVWSAPIFGRGPGPPFADGIVPFAWPLALLITAELVRLVRARIAQNAHAREEEERRRHEETRRRASEERLRIAQELHDVLAHNISMINVQASTALHLLDDQPERARPSLSAIKDASKEALGELRSALDVLRDSGERAPRAPTAGLGELDDLLDRARSAGLAVDMSTDGRARPLPPGADLAAFRIVQEALTNVVRHAGAEHVSVTIGYHPGELTVEVTDDGTGSAAAAEPGNGIIGMRERAATLGGELTAGPRPGGGFRVHARLPVRDTP